MLFFMLTNIIEESTTLMYYGEEAAAFIEEAFRLKPENGTARLPGVVSRKKQLIPAFMEAINKESAI